MAELTFSNVNGAFVAEFTASTDFNLHVEHEGIIEVYQSSVSGAKPALVQDLFKQRYDKVIDTTVMVPVPPIYMRVVCTILPTKACVISKS